MEKTKYVPPEIVNEAKNISLLDYILSTGYMEIQRVGQEYHGKNHDSLVIRADDWFWNSRGLHGKNAVNFFERAEGYDWRDACAKVYADMGGKPVLAREKRESELKEVKFPLINETETIVKKYLMGRGIAENIIDQCVKDCLIFETEKYHNCLFVGQDKIGYPRYGAERATSNQPYKRDCAGSDKRFSFSLVADPPEAKKLYVAEGAIDALSIATFLQRHGRDWRKAHILSLGGVSALQNGKLPAALERYLTDYPDIQTIFLCLDNDQPGRSAAKNLQKTLCEKGYRARDSPPKIGKDYNDYLVKMVERDALCRKQRSR